MSRPKRQHWCPQFYLRYFSTPETRHSKNRKVWYFERVKSGPPPELRNVRSVAHRRNLYSPRDQDTGVRGSCLERKLSDLEDTAARIWPQLAEGFVDFENREPVKKFVALFLATMYLRNPHRQEEMKAIHLKMLMFLESLPKDNTGAPAVSELHLNGQSLKLDPSTFDAYRDAGRTEVHQWFAERIERDAIWLAERLLERRWSVIFADWPCFVTTDRPFVLENRNYLDGFGLNTEGSSVLFPLSPTRVLVLDNMHSQPSGQYYPLLDGDPTPINLVLWTNTDGFMVSGRPTDEILSELVYAKSAWNYYS